MTSSYSSPPLRSLAMCGIRYPISSLAKVQKKSVRVEIEWDWRESFDNPRHHLSASCLASDRVFFFNHSNVALQVLIAKSDCSAV